MHISQVQCTEYSQAGVIILDAHALNGPFKPIYIVS